MIYKKLLVLFLVCSISTPFVYLKSSSQITLLPDLSVESIDPAPSSPVVYDNVTIKILIKNKGKSNSPIVHGRLYVDSTV
ncbi:MAG: CARDB domain-containing protein [Candidatus Thermoplasmatota archaeon]|nr:CARDB domain-containing protein [Candidatus Thermoplasmatota archaeon]